MAGIYQSRIKFNGKKVTLKGFGFDKYLMLKLGQFGRDTVVNRVQSGIGSDDNRLPGLKRGYAIQKTKAGKGNIRNMTYTGQMLDNLSVRSADEKSVKIAFTTLKNRQKARANEQKTPWLSFSNADTDKIVAKAGDLFKNVVKSVQSAIPFLRRRAA